MSDKRIPFHLCDISNPPSYFNQQQQQYLPFIAPKSSYELKFPGWYAWAVSYCEVCNSSSHRNVIVDDIGSIRNINSSSICIYQQPSCYAPHEKWTLQQALIYICRMFIDKSVTVNHWAGGFDPTYSTLSRTKRNKMIHYTIHACFATTYLIRPVLQYWSFQQVINSHITNRFQALSSSSSQVNNNILKTDINQ
ncbi:unnamed protein product [Rotaria sordida]|uniref:Uncharacterized protein n=1 Tax=Rotaria sordida TaxID=392033 RepID=A0A819TUS4_9BILA|nr:unnamed protein product [Rotaria sordida]CAF4080954.1 unnamed protein product [Rotaria sordida]